MFCREICRLLEIASLPTHSDRCFQVKLQISFRSDEFLELLNILEFCIAIEQQRGMVCRCSVVLVQLFEIFDEIMYPLCIKKLEDC